MDSFREVVILKSYWLGQVLFYAFFKMFGAWGLIGLRVLALLTTGILVVVRMARLDPERKTIDYCSGVAVIGALLIFVSGDRPQYFSFAFFAAIVLVVENETLQGLHKTLLLGALMAIWANLHAGWMLGSAFIVAYGISKWLFDDRRQGERPYFVVAALAGLLNPAGYSAAVVLLNPDGRLQSITAEYVSALEIGARTGSAHQALIYYSLFAGLVIILERARSEKAKAIMTLALLVGSLAAFRYHIFFAIYSLPLAYAKLKTGSYRPPLRRAKALYLGFGIAAIVVTVGRYPMVQSDPVLESRYFSVQNAPLVAEDRGKRVLNHLDIGGYLQWNFPDLALFVDGRGIDENRVFDYTHVIWATDRGIQVLRQFDAELVVLPLRSPLTGEVYKLHQFLQNDRHWNLRSDRDGLRVWERRT